MRKKKFAATAVALAMAAVTVFSVGGSPAYANENVDIAIQTETASESVVLPVSVASEAWIYSDGSREFGTWKALNIKVNDTMYPLSKDGAVNVTFSNGDEIKIYSGDSYELWEGTISISGDEVNVTSQNNFYSGYTGTTRWGCNLVYSDGTLTLSKTKNYTNGGGIAFGGTQVSYMYDLTAKGQDGTPIEGVSVVQDETQVGDFSWLRAFVWYGYIKEHSEWGNGNSFDVIEGESDNPWSFKSVVVTDQNGYADMYLPAQCKYGDYEGDYPNVYVGGSANAVLSAQGSRNAYISNGLVDVTIDDEYYTNTKTLGIEPTFGALGTDYDKILGDYYDAKKLSKKSSNTVTLKDTTGNDIAVVTMGIKETADIHLLGKDGETYKVTGLEPVVDIKMADGVTDWTVSVTSDDNNNADNTLHINAVKSGTAVSSDSYTVDLGDSQTISADTFASILAENATKDVIIKSNNNVTFTFAKGTMASVDGKTEYDFSTSIVNAYADTMPSYITKDNFVSQINYNYSGKLPATANIRFYAGTEYAGQTLYYSLMNADNTFAEVQAVVVDADGYMTVKQDHCSSYVVTKTEPKLPSNDDTKTDNGNTSNNGNTSTSDNNTSSGNTTVSTDKNASSANTTATSPKTGDMTPIAIYVVMAVAAVGVIVFVKRRKTA
uniref:hypothetical protein n=1 Tax=Lachnospira eligens TaxID=39485 RepID=UPI0040294CC7